MAPAQLPREVLHKILGIAVENEVVKVNRIVQGEGVASIHLTYSDTLKALLDVEEIKDDVRLMAWKKATLDLTETPVHRMQHLKHLVKEHVHGFQNVRAMLLPYTCLKKEVFGGLFDKVEHLSLVSTFRGASAPVNGGSSAETIARVMKSFFPLVEGATVKVLMAEKKLDQAVDDELYVSFRILPDSDKDEKASVIAEEMYTALTSLAG